MRNMEGAAETKIIAPDAAQFDVFGSSVSLSGNYAIIGAPGRDFGSDVNAGIAYIYVKSGNAWNYQETVVSPAPEGFYAFGDSVGIGGDYAVVGETGAAGKAHVFYRSGSSWPLQATLTAGDAADGDLFGESVAISADTVIAGAYGRDESGKNQCGAAYVFLRSGTTWTQQAKLLASDGAGGDQLGYGVAISGEYVVAGAPMRAEGGLTLGGPGMAVAGEARAGGNRPSAEHPNILVILADQWNPYCLGHAGAVDVKTPNLDALAREGASFSACYTTSPVCMPARTGIVSGLYPHNLSLWNNSTTYYAPPAQAPMFADLKRAGYGTAQIGKLHWFSGGKSLAAFADTQEYFQAMGLDVAESMGVDGGGAFEQRVKELGQWEAYSKDMEQRYLKDQYEPRPSLLSPEDHCDSIVAQRAIEHLQSRPPGRPWLTVVSFSGPHPPLDAPGRYATMYDPAAVALAPTFAAPMKYGGKTYSEADMRRMKANYLGKMSLIDDRIGEIVEAVKSRGEWDNTLVIFACDHGETMGAHNCLSKGRFYEESARVPLIVRWPGTVAAGTTVAAPVQLFDIYPTVVEAAGGAVTPGRFAQSLLPLFQGAEETRPAVFSEISNKDELRYMVRTRGLKWFVADGEEHLYDMEADPYETKNLVGDAAYKDEIQAMHARLLDFLMKSQFNISAGYVPKVQRMREAQKTLRALP